MARKPMPDGEFSRLIADLRSETDSTERKLAKLYHSLGYFSGSQAASLVRTFKTTPERMLVLRILEPRLCQMSCEEGENILRNIQLTQQDKVNALGYIKRYYFLRIRHLLLRALFDHQTMRGVEHIMRAFIHEEDKKRALKQLCTVGPKTNWHDRTHFLSSLAATRDTQVDSLLEQSQHEHQLTQTASSKHASKGANPQNFSADTCHHPYTCGRQSDSSNYIGGDHPPSPPRPIGIAVTGPARQFDSEAHKSCYRNANPCLGLEQSGVTSIGFIDH